MSDFLEKCPRCHTSHEANHAFFSRDHAAYFAPDESFLLVWCRHCGYVSHWTRAKALGFIKLPAVKLADTFHIDDIAEQECGKIHNEEMGLFSGAHLVRMIWYSCLALAEEEDPQDKVSERAFVLAFDALSVRELALMVAVAVNCYRLVPLDQQIFEGKYLGDVGHKWTAEQFTQWIREQSNTAKGDAVLAVVKDMLREDG